MTTLTAIAHAPAETTPAPLAGMHNIFRKEVQEWFRTRRFLATAILTSLLTGAAPVIMFLYNSGLQHGRLALSPSTYNDMMDAWVGISVTLGALLLVALTMGILIKEEESGTAQWVFTKPVSRLGYGLAKWGANSLVAIVGAVLIPATVSLGLTEAVTSTGIRSWAGIFGAIGLMAFYMTIGIALIMALSSIFRSQAPVAGLAIVMIYLPIFFEGITAARIWSRLFPVMIGQIASSVAQGRDVVSWESLVSSIVLLPLCLAFSCYRLSRKQLQ